MSLFPYFVCALLGVDSLRGGLAEGNRICVVYIYACLPFEENAPNADRWISGLDAHPLGWGKGGGGLFLSSMVMF